MTDVSPWPRGGSSWPGFVLWSLLAGIGLAAALALIDSGPHVRYQHFRPIERWHSGEKTWAFVALAAQWTLVSAAIVARRRQIVAWLRLRATWARWVACFALISLPAAALSRTLAAYLPELAFAACVQAINLANAALIASSTPAALLARLRRQFASSQRGLAPARQLDAFTLSLAAFAGMTSAALCWFAYDRHPHVPDEACYLLQAKCYAEGLLAAPLPKAAGAFELDLMNYETDRWHSCFPPGWPALLAPATRWGAQWLVNPLFTSLNVWLTALLLGRMYDRRTARIGAMMLSCSPWFLLMGMSFMAHQATLTLGLTSALCMVRLLEGGGMAWAGAAGLIAGLASLMRPLDGVIVGCVVAAATLTARGWRRKIAALAILGVGAVFGASPNFPYNDELTGSPLRFPVMAYFDKYYTPGANAMGFGSDRGLGWTGLDPFHGHGLKDVAINAAINGFATNVELFGWGAGSFGLAAFLVLSGKTNRRDTWMLAAIASVVGWHSLYWFSGGPDFGARYWYLAIVPCVALSARGLQALAAAGETEDHVKLDAEARLATAVIALCLLSATIFVPWRAFDKYKHYRGMRSDIRELAARHRWSHDLVLIQGERHPDYDSAAVYNAVAPTAGEPLFAWDRDPQTRHDVLAAYGDRRVWLVAGPSRTGSDFRVVAGPVEADSLPELEDLLQTAEAPMATSISHHEPRPFE